MKTQPRPSTSRAKSNKDHSKTNHNSISSSTSKAIQPSLNKYSRVKVRKQSNQNIHFSETFPLRNLQIQAPLSKSNRFNSNKTQNQIQYYKNQCFMLKKNNDSLLAKLNSKEKEIQLLRNQLGNLKSSMIQNEELIGKEYSELKQTNMEMQGKLNIQFEQIEYLKKKMKKLKNNYSFIQRKNSQLTAQREDTNQISIRDEYFQKYEQTSATMKREDAYCNSCEEKQKEMQQMRIKYSDQLRYLENYLSFLKEKEVVVEVLEKQVSSKNQCIDYQRNQLEIEQNNSNHLLKVISYLQQRLEEANKQGIASESFCTFRGYQ